VLSRFYTHGVIAQPDVSPVASAGDALFRPVRAGNAFEETVERLLQSIRLGVVGAGERLPPERELAERLGISRVTLREAIRPSRTRCACGTCWRPARPRWWRPVR
jgi:hypothetical protein